MILLAAIFAFSTTVFCLVVGDFSWQNLVFGAVLVLLVMYIFRRQISPDPLPPVRLSFHLLLYSPVLFYYLFVDILKGTYQVVMITLGINQLRRPGIIKISFQDYSPYGVGPIGFFITLSPGSFMVDIDWDERVMLIHVLDASDPEAIRRDADRYLRLWEYTISQAPGDMSIPALPTEDDDE